jgi:hypothetical protein
MEPKNKFDIEHPSPGGHAEPSGSIRKPGQFLIDRAAAAAKLNLVPATPIRPPIEIDFPGKPDALDDLSSTSSVRSSGSSGGTKISVLPKNLPPGVESSTTGKTSVAVAKVPFSFLSDLQVIRSQRGQAYVVMKDKGNRYALDVGGKVLNTIFRKLAHSEGMHLRKADLGEINEFLTAAAEMAAVATDVWYRVAQTPEGIEIDRGDDNHTRFRVTPGKVEVISKGSEVLFYRTPVTRSLPLPAAEGNLKLLKRHLNLNDVDQLLLTAWLSYTLAHAKTDSSKYLHLVLQGGQGTSKSFICNQVILKLLDPSRAGVQKFSDNSKDLIVAAQNAHVLCFDNMRFLRPAMSDVLCMASTGAVMSNRALYTDSDVNVLQIHTALVLNGIHSFIDQDDLMQRCLTMRTLPLPETVRKSESVMIKEIDADRPAIFRGLLELIAGIFLHLPDAVAARPERMMDFVLWLAAMEKAQGTPPEIYQGAYSASLREAQLESLLDNTLAAEMLKLAHKAADGMWTGTPSELFSALNSQASKSIQRSQEWPQSAISLSKRLSVLQISLQSQGVIVTFGRGRERSISISFKETTND